MNRCPFLLLAITAASASWGAPRGASPSLEAAEAFWQALEGGLASQRDAIPEWHAAADSVAARYLAGGRIWVGDLFPDFDGEACNRAGGLMAIGSIRDMGGARTEGASHPDVVLLGLHDGREEERLVVRKLRSLDVLIVGFGARAAHPEAAAGCHAWLESGAPEVVAGAPAASVLAVANLWAFNGEVISACVRRGRMPTVWQSIMMPGSTARNERYLPRRIHDDVLPPAVEAGKVAVSYFDSLRTYLTQFREREWGRLVQAGEAVRSARRAGKRTFACPLGGHLRPTSLDLPGTAGDLDALSRYITAADLADSLSRGDALYIQGYTDAPGELLAEAKEAGATAILTLAGRRAEPPERAVTDIVLDAQWELGDATVPLAGYDVPLLPPSGFMSAALYWVLVLAAE